MTCGFDQSTHLQILDFENQKVTTIIAQTLFTVILTQNFWFLGKLSFTRTTRCLIYMQELKSK